jgi:predicted helicase
MRMENMFVKYIKLGQISPNCGKSISLEWILDQYKEKKPTDPTIAEKFNTYRFADYKEHVIDPLKRVCTVSVETMKIISEMEKV